MGPRIHNARDIPGTHLEDPTARWQCPQCGSTKLAVFYLERRASAVGPCPYADKPWPIAGIGSFLGYVPGSFEFVCDACVTRGITPVREARHV